MVKIFSCYFFFFSFPNEPEGFKEFNESLKTNHPFTASGELLQNLILLSYLRLQTPKINAWYLPVQGVSVLSDPHFRVCHARKALWDAQCLTVTLGICDIDFCPPSPWIER